MFTRLRAKTQRRAPKRKETKPAYALTVSECPNYSIQAQRLNRENLQLHEDIVLAIAEG